MPGVVRIRCLGVETKGVGVGSEGSIGTAVQGAVSHNYIISECLKVIYSIQGMDLLV